MATTTKAQKIRLGVFTVAAGAAVAVVLIVFGGLRFWERRDTYVVYYPGTVRGLEEGAAVTFGGIRVGSVERLDLAPDDLRRVKVTIEVKAGLPIRTDTTAMLEFAGITGLKVIDLRGGALDAPRLPPGGTITAGESILDRFEQQADTLVKRSEQILGSASRVMENLATITDPAQFAAVGEIVAQAQAATRQLAATSEALHAMVTENRGAVRRTVASIDRSAQRAGALLDEELPKLLGNADGLVADLQAVVRGNQAQVRSAVFDLRQAARSFKELARNLRQKPSQLFFSNAAQERKLP